MKPNPFSWALVREQRMNYCWRMKGRVESAPSEGDHKGSPLPCYGLARWGVHGGKGMFLSLYTEIPLSVSFASRVFSGYVFALLCVYIAKRIFCDVLSSSSC